MVYNNLAEQVADIYVVGCDPWALNPITNILLGLILIGVIMLVYKEFLKKNGD